VIVFERDEPGSHASAAAAGMLSPLAESSAPGPFLDLLLDSRAIFPALAAELADETGIDIGYRHEGTLLLALTDGDEAEVDDRFAWQSAAGLEVERLTAEQARKIEPLISPRARHALRFPGDHQVDNRRLARALHLSALAAGVEFRTGAVVEGVRTTSGEIVGVSLDDGDTFKARRVVVAAGCWSGGLRGLPRPVPVSPVHGQLIAISAPPDPPRHVIATPRGYLVPRGERVIAGTTVENIGFDRSVSPAARESIRSAAVEALPSLDGLPVTDHWSGLRPATPDLLPIIGIDPEVRGLIYATGHYRNGILLAPITGMLAGRLALGLEAGREIGDFGIDRFAR
jgi:glycine oxidase